jgi:hypothetical protein
VTSTIFSTIASDKHKIATKRKRKRKKRERKKKLTFYTARDHLRNELQQSLCIDANAGKEVLVITKLAPKLQNQTG